MDGSGGRRRACALIQCTLENNWNIKRDRDTGGRAREGRRKRKGGKEKSWKGKKGKDRNSWQRTDCNAAEVFGEGAFLPTQRGPKKGTVGNSAGL